MRLASDRSPCKLAIRGLFLCCLVVLAGCASLPEDYQRTPSQAFDAPETTYLGKLFAQDAASHPGQSGFALMKDGRNAFTARIGLIGLAQKSIDLQYFIWQPDTTGRILAEQLIAAADRGVRVRALIDDVQIEGRDEILATIDSHPNIEIRLFNPFANRDNPLTDFLIDFDRVNRRMHNKAVIFDNALAIIGGRNVGDIYFQVADDHNYRDLDIAVAGPVVRDVSSVFDYFWNGPWSVPVSALVDSEPTPDMLRERVATMRKHIAEAAYPYPLDQDVDTLQQQLSTIRQEFVWADGKIVWNDPAALDRPPEQGRMVKALLAKADTLQKELLIESPYFVIRDFAVKKMGEMVDRGVRIRVLTNSLASNDVIAAHAGHAMHREDLLREGVQIYEMRADADTIRKRLVIAKSRASLHAKTMVFDRESIFVGSFNLDPRSSQLNTEAGIYVESPELAQQLAAFMDDGVKPANAYHVVLDDNGDLVWITEEDGKLVDLHEEPGASLGNSFMTGLIQMLPVEGNL